MSGRAELLGQVAETLLAARTIAICAHVDPDGDAMGSTLGLTHLLRGCGATVTPLLASGDRAPSTYAFLPGAGELRRAPASLAVDLFVALDAPDPARLGDARDLALNAKRLVVIDHHPDNKHYGTLNLVDERAAATGELLWELLPHLGCAAERITATCLFTALMTDTGRFSYGNTTPSALRHAAEMIEAGANVVDLYRRVYENRSPGALALVARTVGRLTFANDGHVAYSWIDTDDFAETGALPEETENLIDEIRVVSGVDAVALLKVAHDSVRVSLRAKNGYDVGLVARTLGGGGHAAAAGFTRAGSLESVLAELLPLLPSVG
ncbi:MAG: bifunctional oligoribonuclease/PAP phosphatase NrnA [Actinobacteria bacterium]|nr:MAG: bifunctional oligoribonuclease/PAP phosphatase NrnA [Actinomycetota bacterium]